MSTKRIVLLGCRKVDGLLRSQGVQENYLDALSRTGLVPLLVPHGLGPEAIRQMLGCASGVLFTGGEDLSSTFGGTASSSPRVMTPDPSRDESELALFAAARERKIPMLAICRGIQLANVAHGGRVLGDIEESNPKALQHLGQVPAKGDANADELWRNSHHEVLVESGTRLHQLVGMDRFWVNSYHHQAIDSAAVGNGLIVSAKAPDGTIEAIESLDPSRFMLGVQWHPEIMARFENPEARALFQGFAREVEKQTE